MPTIKLICGLAFFFFLLRTFLLAFSTVSAALAEFNQCLQPVWFHLNRESPLSPPNRPRQFPSQCAVANFWLRSWKGEPKPSEGRSEKLASVDNEMSAHRWGGEQKERRARESGSRRIKSPLVLFNPAGVHLSRARAQSAELATVCATVQRRSKVPNTFSCFSWRFSASIVKLFNWIYTM